MKRWLCMLAVFSVTSSIADEPSKTTRLYDQWVSQPERERTESVDAQRAQKARNVLTKIITEGTIISIGEGPNGRSHTYVLQYNGLLYSCYLEILGAGRCVVVTASQ